MKIGILYICTGKYTIFWRDFYLSCEKYFIKNVEKEYFVFTDSPEIDFENENKNIHRVYQENLGWPGNTLFRFEIFLRSEKKFSDLDYLFFCNANLLFLNPVSSGDFLPLEDDNLVATLHPGYYKKKRKKYTYESNKFSTAYIPRDRGEYYFAGGLNGGKTKSFLKAIKVMKDNIEEDFSNNIVAVWHDESHWNKYLVGRNDVKILSPSYLYPEGKEMPFKKIVLVRNKKKFGGHDFIRGDKVNFFKKLSKKIINKIKIWL